MSDLDEDGIINDAANRELAISQVSDYIRHTAAILTEASNIISGLIKERALFMACLLKIMLDYGLYDISITEADISYLQGYKLFTSVEEESSIKISIVFPDQGIKNIIDK